MTKTNLLHRQSLADAVVSKLQQLISLGEYGPGQKLPSEPELMEKFGVGRSTIREAIRILANTGLLIVRQGSGTYVEKKTGIEEPLGQRLRRADAPDIDEVRQLLEMKVAQKAALHRTVADIEKMKEFLRQRDEYARAGQTEETIQADIQFHVAIAAASGNDILSDMYRTFAEHLTVHFRQLHRNTGDFIRTQKLHESLLESIVGQNPEEAWDRSAKIVAH